MARRVGEEAATKVVPRDRGARPPVGLVEEQLAADMESTIWWTVATSNTASVGSGSGGLPGRSEGVAGAPAVSAGAAPGSAMFPVEQASMDRRRATMATA